MTQPLELHLPDGMKDKLQIAAAANGLTIWKMALRILEEGLAFVPDLWTVRAQVITEWLPDNADVAPLVWQQPQFTERGEKIAKRACGLIMDRRPIHYTQFYDGKAQLVATVRAIP